jgi:NitT/TauT family transport system substrate-binding protein
VAELTSGRPVFRILPHMRLQEWVAEALGLFAAEGLVYTFTPELTGMASSVQPIEAAAQVREVRGGAFEDMGAGQACDINAACHWAVNAAASTTARGKMWGRAYSVCPAGIVVPPDSTVRRPEDLAGVEVGVGYHSGSHYSALQGLEPFLGRDQIALRFIGRPNDRVRLALQRQVAAANVFGAQLDILEQLGFRKIVDTTFMMGFLVGADAQLVDVERYFRALQQAQRAIDLEPERFKPLWLTELADEFKPLVDVRRFGPGERIVFEPYTREMFERTHRWLQGWDLLAPEPGPRARYEAAVLA